MSEAVLQWFGEAAVSALILIGAFFLLVGSYALAKLPDTMRRLHGPHMRWSAGPYPTATWASAS